MTRRPTRKKADRLTRPHATPAAIRCDFGTAAFDETARQMDRKWGVDRLPSLVPQDMADKYARAFAAMNDALSDEDPERTAWCAENCVKGMRAMDAAAEAAGQAKADPHAYTECAADDGPVFAVLHDDRFWPAVKEARPDLIIATKREVAIALDFKRHELVRAAESAFPQAEVIAIRKPEDGFYEKGGDELPF